MSTATSRFGDVQCLRAIACIMVILQHLNITTEVFNRLPGQPTIPLYLGVELFFIISGFVVTRSLFNRDANAVGFLVRRMFRLTPAIVTFILFSMLVFTLISALPNQTMPLALNMVGATEFVQQSASILLGVFVNFWHKPLYYFGAMWSLSVEYQFYFAYAALAGALSLLGLSTRSIKSVMLAVALVLIAVTFLTRIKFLLWPVLGVDMPFSLHYGLVWRFDFLLYGVALAFLTERLGPLPLPRRSVVLAFASALLLATLAVAMQAESPLSATKPFADQVLIPLAALTFTALVALATGRTAVVRERGAIERGLIWLGDRSFSMYLFHYPVMALIWLGAAHFWPRFIPNGFWIQVLSQTVMTFVVTIVLADLTFRHVELRFNAVGERVSRWIIDVLRVPSGLLPQAAKALRGLATFEWPARSPQATLAPSLGARQLGARQNDDGFGNAVSISRRNL